MQDLVAAELGALEAVVAAAALADEAKGRAVGHLGKLAGAYRRFFATYEEQARQELLAAEQAVLRAVAACPVTGTAARERFDILREQLGVRGAGRRAA